MVPPLSLERETENKYVSRGMHAQCPLIDGGGAAGFDIIVTYEGRERRVKYGERWREKMNEVVESIRRFSDGPIDLNKA